MSPIEVALNRLTLYLSCFEAECLTRVGRTFLTSVFAKTDLLCWQLHHVYREHSVCGSPRACMPSSTAGEVLTLVLL